MLQSMSATLVASLLCRQQRSLLPVQVWAFPTTAMQCEWLGERVATVDATRAIRSVIEGKEDAGWGPNAVFRQAGPVQAHAQCYN